MLHLVHVRNALQPSVDKYTREIEYAKGESLDGVLVRSSMNVDGEVVSLNGLIVPLECYALTFPRDEDYIVSAPRITGAGIWRTLATVAVMVAAVAAGAFSLGAGFALFGLTALTTSALVAGAVSVAGNLLVSALLPAPMASNKSQTPSYAFDGPHSLAQSGTVIPKGYGTFLSGGNVISSFVDVEGQDQYLNALVCYGFGPGRSVTGIEINGKDIGTFYNVEYDIRLGTNTQAPIPRFNRIVNGYPQEIQCLAGMPIVIPGTGDLTESLQVDIQFPDGIFQTGSKGGIGFERLTYLVEYAVSGTDDWQPVLQPLTTHDIVVYNEDGTVNTSATPYWVVMPNDQPAGTGLVYSTDTDVSAHYVGEPWNETESVTTSDAQGDLSTRSQTFSGTWQICDPTMNQVAVDTWSAGYIDYINNSAQTLYNRTSIYGLAPNKYDVQVTKYGSNAVGSGTGAVAGDNFVPGVGQDMWVHSVNEITYNDLAYPNMILLGVRALATGQLSGGNINVTALVEYGLRTVDNNMLPAALQVFEDDNPACVAADMMLDPLYGGGQFPGIALANIERYIDEWVAWANLNDEVVPDGDGLDIRRHVFNGIFDSEQNLWQALNVVCQMSRSCLIPQGLDYGVFADQVDTPVQMFTMGNIIQDSFQETWLALDDRSNQVEIQFADSTRYYRQDNPIAVMDPANQDAGVSIKNTRIAGTGITIPAQAWHLANFKLRCTELMLRTGQFKCDVSAVACRPGNLILLQHDVPQWGWGGRVLPGSTYTAVIPDRTDIPFVEGTSYNLIVLHPFLPRYAGTVIGVVGQLLTIDTFDNAHRVTRAIFATAGTPNLLLNPTFEGLFTAWVTSPRAGDSLITDNSTAFYTVNGNDLTSYFVEDTATKYVFLQQTIPHTFSAGQSLILSGYVQVYGQAQGTLALIISFTTGSESLTTAATLSLAGATTNLERIFSAPILAPTGATSVIVTAAFTSDLRFGPGRTEIPIGATVVLSQLQLEIVAAGVTAPTPYQASGTVTDCAIDGTFETQIQIVPQDGFTPAAGMVVSLYDTDAMETVPVTGVTSTFDSDTNQQTALISLGSPLSMAPRDYCAYLYGPAGSESKMVRVTAMRKASEFRQTIEWIEYQPDAYTDGTPVIGETSAVVQSNPGVTNLEAAETFNLDSTSASYQEFISVTWKNGPNTAGVNIYGGFAGGSPSGLLIRLTAQEQSWKFQVSPGEGWTETWTFTVVGFDGNGYFAEYSTAPTVTLTAVGPTANFLIGSTFQSGLAYWNTTLIAATTDTITAVGFNSGPGTTGYLEFIVGIDGTPARASTPLFNQIVPSTATGYPVPGSVVILSGYVSALSPSAAVGTFNLTLMFINAAYALISEATAAIGFAGGTAQPPYTRINTGPVTIPAGTVLIKVKGSFEPPAGAPYGLGDLAIGSVIRFTQGLLEIAASGQTLPSAFTGADITTQVIDVFTGGSSTSLRTQASTLRTFNGDFALAITNSNVTVTFTNLSIAWPDGSYTYISDNTPSLGEAGGDRVGYFQPLSASTTYWMFLTYDIIAGQVILITGPGSVGTLAPCVFPNYDANLEAQCSSDRRVNLTPGGLKFTTLAAGDYSTSNITARGSNLPQGGNPVVAPTLPA